MLGTPLASYSHLTNVNVEVVFGGVVFFPFLFFFPFFFFLSFFLDDSLSMPSVVSEQEAYLMGAIGRRRFSSHLSSVSAPQAEVGMLPSQR